MLAVEIARLPQQMRGFGHIKERNVNGGMRSRRGEGTAISASLSPMLEGGTNGKRRRRDASIAEARTYRGRWRRKRPRLRQGLMLSARSRSYLQMSAPGAGRREAPLLAKTGEVQHASLQ